MIATMILAQALGEYAAMAAIAEAATTLGYRLEELIGDWGIEALLALVVAAVVWRIVGANR